jgi:hypothetical protein
VVLRRERWVEWNHPGGDDDWSDEFEPILEHGHLPGPGHDDDDDHYHHGGAPHGTRRALADGGEAYEAPVDFTHPGSGAFGVGAYGSQ